jgi:hypothetical protein
MESGGTARHLHSEPWRYMEVGCQLQDGAVLSLGWSRDAHSLVHSTDMDAMNTLTGVTEHM